MFGIGVPELMIILVIGLVVFGPGKLPEIGRALGKTINEFKKMSASISLDTHRQLLRQDRHRQLRRILQSQQWK